MICSTKNAREVYLKVLRTTDKNFRDNFFNHISQLFFRQSLLALLSSDAQ